MNNDAPVQCGDYLLYPLGLHLPQSGKWQAIVVITLGEKASLGKSNNTLPHTKSFPAAPTLFEDEAGAKAYALRYGQMLIAGNFKELPA